ncbi:transcription factor BIM2-like isoform X2 [Cynara cardunculus var. scolymus]|uniref:transcription factor BIM2-like isoform X2 n=1 Tax=Cynara cardunculus var. scolymus TaxID=59895 RepID=UPI000D62F519|nr:transcription factor BIM2-like isoform X2 [Cynara cardunculus var. scolymus]
MVRTVKNHHHQEEEEDDEDFISRTTDGSSQKDGRRNDQKASSHRSKHSETEQRRRSKINERFQILRDLIPQNDQKRDRASFLLEVYEGAYQGWSPEPTKLMPWRGNCGADNFADQSPPIKNGSVDEGNIVFAPALLTNVQNLVESDLNGSAGFKATDHGAARAVSMDVPLQQNTFEAEPTHTSQGSFPDVELLASQSRTQPWNARPVSSEGAIQSCTPSEMEELKMQREEASISNAYSKGLLNNLTQALGSSGVDLSQACISVQFDIRKRASSGATSTSFSVKDHDFLSPGNQATTHCAVRNGDDVCNQAHKRPRTEQNQ